MIGDPAKGMLLYSAFGLVAQASSMIGPRFPLPPHRGPSSDASDAIDVATAVRARRCLQESLAKTLLAMLHPRYFYATANVLLVKCTVACISRTIKSWNGAPRRGGRCAENRRDRQTNHIPRSGSRSTPVRINPNFRLGSEVDCSANYRLFGAFDVRRCWAHPKLKYACSS